MVWWILLFGIGALFVVAAITVAVLIKKAIEYLKRKREEIEKKGVKRVEIKVKEIIEKGGKKVVVLGLKGKRKTLIPFRRTVNLGEVGVKGDKLEDDIKKGQVIKKVNVEEL